MQLSGFIFLLIPFVILFILHIFINPILRILSDEKSKNRLIMQKEKIVFILITITVIGISIYVISSQFGPTKPIKLDNVEIKEYKGQKLSSFNDFREKSIKEPQYINITNYKLEVTGLVSNPQNYTYNEVICRQNNEKVVKLDCVEGWDVTILWKEFW